MRKHNFGSLSSMFEYNGEPFWEFGRVNIEYNYGSLKMIFLKWYYSMILRHNGI